MNIFTKSLAWFLAIVTDENKKGLSLSRVLFIISVLAAHYNWTYLEKEIPTYQFSFIVINLMYILFKDRSLTILSKVMDSLVAIKSVSGTIGDSVIKTEVSKVIKDSPAADVKDEGEKSDG